MRIHNFLRAAGADVVEARRRGGVPDGAAVPVAAPLALETQRKVNVWD